MPTHGSEADVVRYSFIAEDLHLQHLAGFSGAPRTDPGVHY